MRPGSTCEVLAAHHEGLNLEPSYPCIKPGHSDECEEPQCCGHGDECQRQEIIICQLVEWMSPNKLRDPVSKKM